MRKTIKIGTRASQLAVKQAELAKQTIQTVLKDTEIEIVTIKTKGDKILHKTLDKIGGKGIFVKEIENALLNGTIDIAVHSMKDMPDEMPKGLELGAVLKRENPMDALVCAKNVTWENLPKGAKVGTGSLRRKTQLLTLRNDLNIIPIRGNIMTRLQKLETELDAVVLAVAGLMRTEQQHKISHIFQLHEMVPAACQGILALQIRKRSDFLKQVMKNITDNHADICQRAERAFLNEIGADCHAPAGALANIENEKIYMKAMFYTDELLLTEGYDNIQNAEELGKKLAMQIQKQSSVHFM
ncbi:MAG: hydroxymethylbilane synthase [Firmicutes bacterium]|jgi:hydroxymethylbilane synthase|nr:hydroxymethylbilane synthase [Bacillota bacterium]